MVVGHRRRMPRVCLLRVNLARSRRQGSWCASALAHGVGRRCLACLDYPIGGPMSTPMVSRLSRVIAIGIVRGKRHPNATAPSHQSSWVSASTASCTSTSPLNVALRPAASAARAPTDHQARACTRGRSPACKRVQSSVCKPSSLLARCPNCSVSRGCHTTGPRCPSSLPECHATQGQTTTKYSPCCE
jgi:hypothetical protein